MTMVKSGFGISMLVVNLLSPVSVNATLYINQGDNPDFVIAQTGKEITAIDGTVTRLQLERKQFVISSIVNQYYLCLSEDKVALEKMVATGANVKSDFNSCFFIWKLYGGSADQDYLVVSDGGSNSVNEAHGLKLQNDGRYAMAVREFLGAKAKKSRKIAEQEKPLYGAFWIDKNRDSIVDEHELKHVQFDFH
jgi:hypothetical protein